MSEPKEAGFEILAASTPRADQVFVVIHSRYPMETPEVLAVMKNRERAFGVARQRAIEFCDNFQELEAAGLGAPLVLDGDTGGVATVHQETLR